MRCLTGLLHLMAVIGRQRPSERLNYFPPFCFSVYGFCMFRRMVLVIKLSNF